MINFTKELPQTSEHNCDSIRTYEAVFKNFQGQYHLEVVYDIRSATCISDAVFQFILSEIFIQGGFLTGSPN